MVNTNFGIHFQKLEEKNFRLIKLNRTNRSTEKMCIIVTFYSNYGCPSSGLPKRLFKMD